MSGKMRLLSWTSVAILLSVPLGCGLLGGNKKPNVEEVPPYYQSGEYATVPMEHRFMEHENPNKKYSVSSRSELDRLQKEADEFAEEQARQQAVKAEREEQKKKGFLGWFGSGDRMSMMSDEAKKINSSLEAKQFDSTP